MVNLSDVSDFFSKGVKKLGTFYRNNYSAANKIINAVTGIENSPATDIADFIDREVVDKSDLRGAEVETFLRGFPIVGGIINGAEGINQLEDLYRNTGKVPAYPGASSPGAAGLGSSLSQLTRKIEDGSNSLHEFYTGEPELSPWDKSAQVKYAPDLRGWKTLI